MYFALGDINFHVVCFYLSPFDICRSGFFAIIEMSKEIMGDLLIDVAHSVLDDCAAVIAVDFEK